MFLSSLQEDRPNDNGAAIPDLESAELIREVLSKLLEDTHTMQKTTQTEFLNIVESFAEAFQWCLEPHKNEIENNIHTYITAHDLHHQVRAQGLALPKTDHSYRYRRTMQLN
ncbi:MAG: hypothetical protein LQ347_001242 [Umbilicaria vellea]|nr:MAG: hypothetical protein LQ347_001242 [Umbilicaria vellea]